MQMWFSRAPYLHIKHEFVACDYINDIYGQYYNNVLPSWIDTY